jgi:hypothetical protein
MSLAKAGMYLSILALAVVPVYALKVQANADVVAAITKLENDQVKADLAQDKSWSEKYLADDWMGCDSSGKWYSKPEVLKMLADAKNNNYKSEKVSNLKVRVYGTTAVATYTDSYEGTVAGEHRVRTILATDVWAKIGADWKLVSGHSTPTK